MKIVLISGISGSGKSVALNMLEDLGYVCVDNLPPSLLSELVATFDSEGRNRVAVAIDSRSGISLEEVPKTIETIRKEGHDIKALFLTADTRTLVGRFSETRRNHPLSHRLSSDGSSEPRSLVDAIRAERELLTPLEKLGHNIDTTNTSANQLRNWVKEFVETDRAPLTLYIESFAFRQGAPRDASLVFDVRSLPNPHYDPELRPFSGLDSRVATYLEAQPEVADMLADITAFVDKWLPSFKQDNRSYVTVAIGCTGGQHRSVYMVEKLAKHFRKNESVVVHHRGLM
ncbi:MAG: RNase adapter RapZ [Oxalobacter sp.]|nr:MAG: RNase adapter RapZ [Oxalobacter sp.]